MCASRIVDIERTPLTVDAHPASGRSWRHLELDCERLGVRVEELEPGEASSVHHWHTQEEEHVLILAGAATLVLGPPEAREEVELTAGDHVCFHAGDSTGHHLEARGDAPVRMLVFGERLPGDVVVYPDAQVMRVKAMDPSLYTCRPLPERDPAGSGD